MTALAFDSETAHLPPGRVRVTFDEAHRSLVLDPRFSQSQTRPTLWRNLEKYLARFAQLEEQYSDLLPRPLVPYLWLGGSFASGEPDPRNIDMTVCIDGEGREALRGRQGGAWMNAAFKRRTIQPQYGIAPVEMKYWPVASVFNLDELQKHELDYLRRRGGWDDWWQRQRLQAQGATRAPTVESAHTVRGYLEVTL